MTNRGLVVLSVRLFALFIALQALLSPLQPHSRGHMLAAGPIDGTSSLLGLLLCLSVAALLWVCVGRIADVVLPMRRGRSIAHGRTVTVDDAQVIAYSAVGLYLAADSLPDIAIAAWPLLSPHLQITSATGPLEGVAAPAIRLVLGATLFLGARGLASFVRELRRAPAR